MPFQDVMTFQDADQEVRALSFILSSLESSRVINFDEPIERYRPEIAKPLRQIANILVRRTYDSVAIGALVKGKNYCSIALDHELSGTTNLEAEGRPKIEVSFEDEEIFGRTWSSDDVMGFVTNYANHSTALLSFRSHVYLLQKLWQQTVQAKSDGVQLLIYVLVMAYNKIEASYNRAVIDLNIQPPTDRNGQIPYISFRIGVHVNINKFRNLLPSGVSLSRQVETDIELGIFTRDVYKFVATYIATTLKRAQGQMRDLSRNLSFGSKDNTTPRILTTEISEKGETVIDNIFDALESQMTYYNCMEHLKPLLPCFEKALDTYNEIWGRGEKNYARLDQDSTPPMTYGQALINLLKEPLIHVKGVSALLAFAKYKRSTPLADLFNGKPQSRINVVEHRWPQQRTMADVKEALENAFAGRDEVSQKILQQVKELITCHEHHFVNLNANHDSSWNIWDSNLKFPGSVHCEAIIAVDLVKHLKDLNSKPRPLLGVSRQCCFCCFVCAQLLQETYNCIPGFDDGASVALEANRVSPVSLPEETDVFIANKIVNQLRDLLHRKLMEEKGRIEVFYDQMKQNKWRTSHDEVSSGDESDVSDEIDSLMSKFMKSIKRKLGTKANQNSGRRSRQRLS